MHGNADFRRVREDGRVAQGRFLRLSALKTDSVEPSRIGVVTSRRVGRAVVRVKVRRRLREISRLHRPELKPGCMVVVVARPGSARARFSELEREWLHLAGRLFILSDSK